MLTFYIIAYHVTRAQKQMHECTLGVIIQERNAVKRTAIKSLNVTLGHFIGHGPL